MPFFVCRGLSCIKTLLRFFFLTEKVQDWEVTAEKNYLKGIKISIYK